MIDFDFAIKYPHEPVCLDRICTPFFMAINVLNEKPYRARQDMESFLYVLLYIIFH